MAEQNGKPRQKIGHRPSLLTKELQGQIVTRVTAGNTLDDAAESLGIAGGTAGGWLGKGLEGVSGPDGSDTTYVLFAEAIKKARAECRVRLVVVLRNAAEGPTVKHHMKGGCPLTNGLAPSCNCPTERLPPNPFIAARMLESIDPKNWLRVTKQEISGPGGAPIEVSNPAERISKNADRIFQRLVGQAKDQK